MRYLIIVFLIGIISPAQSQTIKEIDSLSYAMCDYLKQLESPTDALRLQNLYDNQLYPFLDKLDATRSEQVGNQIYYRLQRNCVGFRDLLDRLAPPKEAPIRSSIKPIATISKKDLKRFKEQKDFYYFEASGHTTHATMKEGFWMDTFTDDTHSKLTYNWISDSEFELVFVESNNESRSNFSVKGDKLVYQVLEKKDNYYVLSVNIPGQEVYEKFRVYYN